MRLIIVTKDDCLNSLMAVNWSKRIGIEVEYVDIAEVPDIALIYGVVNIPSLLKIGDNGFVNRVGGYNEALYNKLLEEI